MNTDDSRGPTRRTVLRTASLSVAPAVALSLDPAGTSAAGLPSRWLGSSYWPNRLQDWMRRNGRIECTASRANRAMRTVAVLTGSITEASAEIRVRTGTLQRGLGFSGFLIGTGTGEADPRSAALVLSASGVGGGILCTYESDGRARFRDHTDESAQFRYAELASTFRGPAPGRQLREDVDLVLDISPVDSQRVRLTLRALDHATGRLLSQAVMSNVPQSAVTGGISLVSSHLADSGARFWFHSLKMSGAGMQSHPDRALGPIVGTLFSRDGRRMRMTVQLMPDSSLTGAPITLQVRDAAGRWHDRASGSVGTGFTAVLSVGNWPSTATVPYRVVTPSGATWTGVVPAEPTGGLVVASLCCVKATHRPTDQISPLMSMLPGAQPLGLYSERNVYFPHRQLIASVQAHAPDLLVVHGDQYYETSPTRQGAPSEEELLYKYIFWLWSFREITRSTPTIVLVDDHDVFQANLWGADGVPAPGGDPQQGGYTHPEFVNLLQRVQCGHNPPPYDPTPVAQGIGVYYTSFSYGGVGFAVIEDRKFKTGPKSAEADIDPLLHACATTDPQSASTEA